MKNQIVEQLITEGFDLMDERLQYLMECLEEALKATGAHDLLPYMPWKANSIQLEQAPEGLSKLYSIGFQLLNIVEERVAAEIRRKRENSLGAESVPGLWPQVLDYLKQQGLDETQIMASFRNIWVEPVLTAHPTEAKRTTIRERHRALYDAMIKNEIPNYTKREKKRIREHITFILETLWRTSEIHLVRPDIYSELRNAIHYLKDLFPASINRLDRHFTQAWQEAGFSLKNIRETDSFPRISFGIWIGGDRDGHPLVTAEVTKNTLRLLRQGAFQLLEKELYDLAKQISVSKNDQDVPPGLEKRIEELTELLYSKEKVIEIQEQHSDEPWRQLAYLMAIRCRDQAKGRKGYLSTQELLEDLDLITQTIRQCGCAMMEEELIYPIKNKLEVFGFHLASLDIRQNSEFHDKAISQLLVAAKIPNGDQYESWDEQKRIDFLSNELESNRPFLHNDISVGKEADGVLSCYRVLALHLAKWGKGGLGSLIVSMTRQLSDLLGVYLLCREAGLYALENGSSVFPLQVVPLFETMEDLKHSPEILSAFLKHPVTVRSRKALGSSPRHSYQQVMLGYSDSNKDCGILAAQFALHEAQQALSQISHQHQVNVCFFHGRGGSISRGAGPTHWFMNSLPHGAMNGGFRMTEQGETIAQKYANLTNATYNLELLLAGTTATTVRHHHLVATQDPCAAFMATLSSASQTAYQNFLKTDGFVEFYRSATPIDALENSRIGSRPARRTGKKDFSINDLRAIPWVFSWTQARYYLPGWYGVGTGLAALKSADREGFKAFKAGIEKSPFMSYVLMNVEANLASSNIEIIQAYAALVEDRTIRERFLKLITDEFYLTQELLNELFDGSMTKRRPRMVKTLQIRELPLKILHLEQIALLKEWRAELGAGNEQAADALLPRLLLSINAIASGLRTTG